MFFQASNLLFLCLVRFSLLGNRDLVLLHRLQSRQVEPEETFGDDRRCNDDNDVERRNNNDVKSRTGYDERIRRRGKT